MNYYVVNPNSLEVSGPMSIRWAFKIYNEWTRRGDDAEILKVVIDKNGNEVK